MSLASYIGCNIKIPTNDEFYTDDFYIGRCFANDSNLQDVKKFQFTTRYAYEVSSDWGISIWEHETKKVREESKIKLMRLCEIMDEYLQKGDYFELYSCWIGEEAEEREGEITIKINNFDVDKIEIPEKILVKFEK
jgi:hypothetical protein